MKKIIITCFAITISSLFIACDNGMSHEVTRKTMTADKAIDNYEWFKMQEAQIKGMYEQEKIQQQELESYMAMLSKDMSQWSKDDKQHIQFLRTVVNGTRTQVNSMIAEYNGKVTMKHKAVFKDNLPTNIVRGTNTMLEFKYDMGFYKPEAN